MNKKITFPFIALGVLAFGTLITQSNAFADDKINSETTIVEKIATKFNLNKDEVQKVFDEERKELHIKMQEKNALRLEALVKEGKITQAQKTLILNKQKEMQKQRENHKEEFKDMTPEERKLKMEARRTNIENWAKENGIDPTYLFPSKGMMSKHGIKMGMQ